MSESNKQAPKRIPHWSDFGKGGGTWLGKIRSWMQSNVMYGDQICWDSKEEIKLRGPLTQGTITEIGRVAATEAVNDYHEEVYRLLGRMQTLSSAQMPVFCRPYVEEMRAALNRNFAEKYLEQKYEVNAPLKGVRMFPEIEDLVNDNLADFAQEWASIPREEQMRLATDHRAFRLELLNRAKDAYEENMVKLLSAEQLVRRLDVQAEIDAVVEAKVTP